MNNFSNIKNLLFDLGGVILDLNIAGTLEGFLNLGFPKELLNYPENFHTDAFFNYETGKTSTSEFRNEIRKISGVNFKDEAFDKAWGAMLDKVPQKRPALLKSLSQKYNLYLLSNTSPLHIEQYNPIFERSASFKMQDVFKKLYYSYEIGFHKPDPEAFNYVLHDANLKPEETLFLDDNIQNIKAAKTLGFNVIHITQNLPMEQIGFDL